MNLWEEQDGRCAGCITPFTLPWERTKHADHFSREYVCVDHDHLTDEVRGLLCGKCNIILGKADDRVDILQNLITYLDTKEND